MTLDSLPDLDTSGLCLVKTLPTPLTCWPYRNTALRDGARTSTRTSSVAKGRTASIHCRPAPPRQTEALSSRTSRSRPLETSQPSGARAKNERSESVQGRPGPECRRHMTAATSAATSALLFMRRTSSISSARSAKANAKSNATGRPRSGTRSGIPGGVPAAHEGCCGTTGAGRIRLRRRPTQTAPVRSTAQIRSRSGRSRRKSTRRTSPDISDATAAAVRQRQFLRGQSCPRQPRRFRSTHRRQGRSGSECRCRSAGGKSRTRNEREDPHAARDENQGRRQGEIQHRVVAGKGTPTEQRRFSHTVRKLKVQKRIAQRPLPEREHGRQDRRCQQRQEARADSKKQVFTVLLPLAFPEPRPPDQRGNHPSFQK